MKGGIGMSVIVSWVKRLMVKLGWLKATSPDVDSELAAARDWQSHLERHKTIRELAFEALKPGCQQW